MAMTSNPVFNQSVFSGYDQVYGAAPATTMTVRGTAIKACLLLGFLLSTAIWSWDAAVTNTLPPIALPAAALAGFVFAMITSFKPNWAPVTAPIYAALEGVVLGALSAIFNQRFPGIAIQAVMLTICTLAGMLTLYVTGAVRVTDRLARGITSGIAAVALVYLATWVLGMFGVRIPFLHDSGPIGIAFSVFVVGLAAFSLLLDFDFIEDGARRGAPKSLEWYGAFGLMVTLIWLYVEVLRLLRKIQDSRN
jgi:uncharacterized YccA/Bax inhibitor family protein